MEKELHNAFYAFIYANNESERQLAIMLIKKLGYKKNKIKRIIICEFIRLRDDIRERHYKKIQGLSLSEKIKFLGEHYNEVAHIRNNAESMIFDKNLEYCKSLSHSRRLYSSKTKRRERKKEAIERILALKKTKKK